jgi:two-component system chemotaxis sensor kinase CheA
MDPEPCMQDFERTLKMKFLDEVGQILADTEQCFLDLESRPGDASLIDKIFRLAHSLKGGAKAVGFDQIASFAHSFESYIVRIRKDEIPKSPAVISLLLRCNDFLIGAVTTLKQDLKAAVDDSAIRAELESGLAAAPAATAGPSADEMEAIIQAEIDRRYAEAAAAKSAPAPAVPDSVPSASSDSFEEPSAADVAALLAAESHRARAPEPVVPETAITAVEAPMIAADAPSNDFGPLREQIPQAPRANGDETVRVSLQRLEKLLNFVGEVVILQTMLREQVSEDSNPRLDRTVHQLGKVTKEVQEITLSLRMVSVKPTFLKMQRIVRDTSLLLDKKVTLFLEGEETELDKTVLESVGDPLVHLVRNAVDHGIESESERVAAGKPAQGSIWLRAFHRGGKLAIEVQDDGGGIDTGKLRKKAIESGILAADAVISEREALHLIFKPGFSTKNEVTEVSGRGVGMDVVKSNIESLQGEVQIETEVGKGTCIRVLLPLTLAIIDGMVVRCGDERFVIPLTQVYESLKPSRDDVQCSTDLSETLILRDECMPIVRLAHSLGRRTDHPAWDCIAIVNRSSERPFAMLVDEIIGQQQIVIKKLGLELQRLRAFTGTAVLGDGKPALIIEASEVASMARPIGREILAKMERKAA